MVKVRTIPSHFPLPTPVPILPFFQLAMRMYQLSQLLADCHPRLLTLFHRMDLKLVSRSSKASSDLPVHCRLALTYLAHAAMPLCLIFFFPPPYSSLLLTLSSSFFTPHSRPPPCSVLSSPPPGVICCGMATLPLLPRTSHAPHHSRD